MKVLVLMGGDSPEREISLQSGGAVAEGLRRAGHEVEALDIPNVRAVLESTALRNADVVFPVLHGGQGEDGHLQAVLDVLEVPYAFSGAEACAVAMDKSQTKRVMRSAAIPTPAWLSVTREAAESGELTLEAIRRRAEQELGLPVVVKLNGSGSSVGVEIVHEARDFDAAFERVAAAADPGGEILLEKFIPGRELTATILQGRRLPLLEIRPVEGFYDYENKYTAGASEYLVPAPVHSPVYEQISSDALRLYELLGCRGTARADFRLDGDEYYCLEINTIPGMTEMSLVPKAAAAVGIGFPELLDDLCRAAVRR